VHKWRLAAVVLVAILLAGSPAADAASAVRLAGPDRYGTAAAIAEATYPKKPVGGGVGGAILVRGDAFADALAAPSGGKAPILLSERTRLPAATSRAIDDLGVTSITILGGEDVISADVEHSLNDRGVHTFRYAGADRYETAASWVLVNANAEDGAAPPNIDGQRTVFVVSGETFADALTIGVVAGEFGVPILLTQRDVLPRPTANALRYLRDQWGLSQVLVVGGTAAVGDSAARDITALGLQVRRIAGPTRQETATAIADKFFTDALGRVSAHINLARGDNFPDALTGAPHAAVDAAPILLTVSPTELGAATRSWILAHNADITDLHVFGDTTAVSDAVVTDATNAADGRQ
jgi:putative cell wall-binding protein